MSVFTRTIPKLQILQKNALKMSLIISQILCGAFCAFTAFGTMFGIMNPLALCFAAAVPSSYALSASAGAAIGYALLLPADASMPYLICIIVLGVCRAFIPITKINILNSFPLFALIASMSFFISSTLALFYQNNETFANLLLILAQTFTVFGLSYLFKNALNTPYKTASQISTQNKASLLLIVMAILISLAPYQILGLKLIHIIGASIALIGAVCGREYSGALLGVAVSTALVIADFSSLYAGFAISVAALCAGFIVKESRFIPCIVFILTALIGVPLASSGQEGLLFLCEISLSCAVVMALPLNAFAKIPIKMPMAGRVSLTVLSSRLQMYSNALASVGNTLNSVCDKLPRYGESYADICDAVSHAICQKCPRNTVCWGTGDGKIYDAFNNMQSILQTRGYVMPEDIPMPLKDECKFPKKLTSALSTAYKMGSQKRFAAARSRTTRAALTEQYNAMACALSQLANEIYREEMPDKRKENKIEKLFLSMGIEPIEINVSSDSYGCLHASIQLQAMVFNENELNNLTKQMSHICRCNLNKPTCQNMFAFTNLQFKQQHLFVPVFGAFTLPALANDVSADVCKTFTDYKGCAHAILCDGMGTGEQAALDGNLAAILSEKLMLAGFAANEAARLVNVALSLKGDEDTGTTLDAFSVNLYTGKAKIFKAGASASFLIRQNVVTVLDGESLPIGILGKVMGRASSMQLQIGDVIVLVSDGVMAIGKKRICALLSAAENMHPKILAKRLVQQARLNAQRPDDITVICMQLEKTNI